MTIRKPSHVFVPIVLSLVCFVLPAMGQEPRLDLYPVAPVELPDLERPALAVDRALLPRGAAGRLPTYDGEFFYITLPRDERPPSPEAAWQVVEAALKALGWTQPMEALQPRKPEDRPLSNRIGARL